MGWIFHRRIKLGKGFGINLSKSTLSPSFRTPLGTIGTKGYSIRTPIRGIYYRKRFKKNSNNVNYKSYEKNENISNTDYTNSSLMFSGILLLIVFSFILLVFVPIFFILFSIILLMIWLCKKSISNNEEQIDNTYYENNVVKRINPKKFAKELLNNDWKGVSQEDYYNLYSDTPNIIYIDKQNNYLYFIGVKK